jgi:hypothetical protein
MWPHIQLTVEDKLRSEIQTKYKTLDTKLQKLIQAQTTPQEHHTLHPRVINSTNIPFSKSKMKLLQKGLKYNTHAKKKDWIQTLGLEAETAITQLLTNERDVYRKLVADCIDTLQRQNTLKQN